MGIPRALLTAASLIVVLVTGPSPATSSRPSAALAAASSGTTAAAPAADDSARAEKILRELQGRYRYLDGVTVSVQPTPHGEQAIAYYTEGRILVSPAHTADIDTILSHEVWHVIDWRDNGRIDWRESLPPSNASAYLINL